MSPTTTTDTAAAQAIAPTPVPAVLGPPAGLITPSPRVGYVPPPVSEIAGFRPSAHVLAAAPTAMANLTSFVDYTALLGSAAPPAASVASAISVALAWRTERAPAQAWDRYVRAQYGLACKAALTLLDELKPLFLAAAAKDPSLALKYQGLAEIFEAPKVAANKSVATKKRKAQEAATAKSTAVTTPAASTETEVPAAAPKAITINT
jgi:hypothetical protein